MTRRRFDLILAGILGALVMAVLLASGAVTATWMARIQVERTATTEARVAHCLPIRYGYPLAGNVPQGLRPWVWRKNRNEHIQAVFASNHCDPWPAWWERGAMCVHSHEGGWKVNTGNGYYGGMQMDMQFQRTHGPDMLRKYGAPAHTWSVRDQLVVSWRAYSGTGPGNYGPRGWQPWPNTARACGLL